MLESVPPNLADFRGAQEGFAFDRADIPDDEKAKLREISWGVTVRRLAQEYERGYFPRAEGPLRVDHLQNKILAGILRDYARRHKLPVTESVEAKLTAMERGEPLSPQVMPAETPLHEGFALLGDVPEAEKAKLRKTVAQLSWEQLSELPEPTLRVLMEHIPEERLDYQLHNGFAFDRESLSEKTKQILRGPALSAALAHQVKKYEHLYPTFDSYNVLGKRPDSRIERAKTAFGMALIQLGFGGLSSLATGMWEPVGFSTVLAMGVGIYLIGTDSNYFIYQKDFLDIKGRVLDLDRYRMNHGLSFSTVEAAEKDAVWNGLNPVTERTAAIKKVIDRDYGGKAPGVACPDRYGRLLRKS